MNGTSRSLGLLRRRKQLVTRYQRADKSKGSCYTRSNFLRRQLKQSNCNNYIHSCFNQGIGHLLRLIMSQRPNTSRRFVDSGSIPFVGSLHPKSRPSPLLSIGLVVVGALLIIGYMYHNSGGRSGDIDAVNRLEGGGLISPFKSLINLNKRLSFRAKLVVLSTFCAVPGSPLLKNFEPYWIALHILSLASALFKYSTAKASSALATSRVLIFLESH